MKKYKFSSYNHKVYLNDNMYLFNALSGGFCKLNKETKDILNDIDIKKDNYIIEKLNEDIIQGFIKGKIILHNDINELEMVRTLHNIIRFSDRNSLGLTLVPTTACNFRCTYCFEKDAGYKADFMSDEVMDAIVDLVDQRLSLNGNLSIAWYGGEPLLAMKNIETLQSRLKSIIKKKNLNVSTAMVSNGYLLTKDKSDKLVELGINNIQITLDGNKEIHDKRRFYLDGRGTYDQIVNNILHANENLNISIRVNIDKDNIDSMEAFLDDLKDKGINNMKNVTIYFSVVRSINTDTKCPSKNCYSNETFSKEDLKLNALAFEKGFNIGINIKPVIGNCAALSPKSFLIEPDGSIQKCWSDVGIKERRIGHLIDPTFDNNLALSNQYKWYGWNRCEDKMCQKCDILPLCMGGCPYYTITENDVDNSTGYRCIGLKNNLDDTLKLVVSTHKSTKRR